MTVRIVVALALIASAAAVALIWLDPPAAPPAVVTAEPERGAEEPEAAPKPPIAIAVARPAEPSESPEPEPPETPAAENVDEDRHDHRALEDPTHDLELYVEYPMSPVPHRVVRGWGARGAGKRPGVVGAFVIVDPGIDDATLAKLASDIRAYHSDAHSLSVRILDSERAATYDRHSDGGELLTAHLVGLVNRNEGLGLDQIMIRGEEIDPSSASATP